MFSAGFLIFSKLTSDCAFDLFVVPLNMKLFLALRLVCLQLESPSCKMFKNIKSRIMNESDGSGPMFRCVNCGHHVKELYKTYSPTIQKLTECEKCGKIADKLIEAESLVIIIDLILLSTQAQRHVLYNSSCKNLYKILMVITLLVSPGLDVCTIY